MRVQKRVQKAVASFNRNATAFCSLLCLLILLSLNIRFALPLPTGYAMLVLLSYPIRQRKGGGTVLTEFLISALVTVVGGVVCHYIIKWLDGDRHDN